MGSLIKTLREEKKLTQEKLSEMFLDENLVVSPIAISNWEKGKSIPEINNLVALSNFLGVTIDEILNGEKENKEDLDKKYPIAKKDWYMDFPKDVETYGVASSQGTLIRSNLKKLLFNYADSCLPKQGYIELQYLIYHFLLLDEDMTVQDFLVNAFELRKQYKNDEEFWWECQKYFSYNINCILRYANICDEKYKDSFIEERMNYLEPWEKDYLLACVSVQLPIYKNYYEWGSKALKRYEDQHGYPFDINRITYETVKYLIKHGAKVNLNYATRSVGSFSTTVVDKCEDYIFKYYKPLKFCVLNDGETNFFEIKNTEKNRFLINHQLDIVYPLKELGYSVNEIWELVKNNLQFPDEIVYKCAKQHNLDLDRDFDLIYSDTFIYLRSLHEDWDKYKSEWRDTEINAQDFLDESLNDLKVDNHDSQIISLNEYEGGITPEEKEEYVREQNERLSYSSFLKGRNNQRTQELLRDLEFGDPKSAFMKAYALDGGNKNGK